MAEKSIKPTSKAGVYANIYKDHAMVFVDGTKTLTGTSKVYESDYMFMIIAGTVIAVTFNYSFGKNNATTKAVTGDTSINRTVTGFDITANGFIITRRRYGEPGIDIQSAYTDARVIMKYMYEGFLDGLDVDDETQNDMTLTTLSTYPNQKETVTIDDLKSKYFDNARLDSSAVRYNYANNSRTSGTARTARTSNSVRTNR